MQAAFFRGLFVLRRLLMAATAVMIALQMTGWPGEKRALSADYRDDFRSSQPRWTAEGTSSAIRVTDHRRIHPPAPQHAYEYFRVQARRPAEVFLETSLPPARVIDDLKLSLYWNSNRNGAVLYLRVVFPRHRHPQTGKALSALVEGDRYAQPGKWQILSAGITQRQIQARLRELRQQYQNPKISSEGMYVTAAVIRLPVDPGTIHAGIAEVRFGPIVAPLSKPGNPSGIRQASVETAPPAPLPLTFRLDRLEVNGYPFVPRIAAYHGETPAVLHDAGVNVVWIPRYDDERLMQELQAVGLWLTATPPFRPESRSSPVTGVEDRNAFAARTSRILFWNVGTRIPGKARRDLIEWVDRIHKADRLLDRPILGDVAGEERIYSRHIGLLGFSRHVLHTSFTLRQYRDWLVQKRRLARPGSFCWTWIQTEPARFPATGTPDNTLPIVVEPEQIRLQVYAALSAGCRGIGFWKTTPLDAQTPGAEERRWMVSQLNLELDLLSPWIATGTVVAQTPFTVHQPEQEAIGRSRLDFNTNPSQRRQQRALLNERHARSRRNQQQRGELQATVIRSEFGTLLLPVWYETNAQFVPAKSAAHNAEVVVHGISESASAWLITTTGITGLVQERVTGGLRITIPRFDQTAAVVLTTNRLLIEQLRKRVRKMAPLSAQLSVKLARAKLKRVRQVDAELSALGTRQPDAPQLLHRAGWMLGQAEAALNRRDYASARQNSANALQLLRILQRAHWNDAVRALSSPVSSPYAVCFQSLPAHWRLVEQFGRSRPGGRENILRSGNFEDIDTMIAEGWRHSQQSHPAVRATAELYPRGKEGSYCLRLIAAPVPGKDPPVYLPQPPVTVNSPPLTVRSGQLVHISGWIQVAAAPVGSLEGVTLTENLTGPRGALRWRKKAGWQPFSLLREVKQSGTLRVTISLHGMGEVRFDDLRITLHNPPLSPAAAKTASPPRSRPGFLDRLPRLSPFNRPAR